jgi:hypothetical protein
VKRFGDVLPHRLAGATDILEQHEIDAVLAADCVLITCLRCSYIGVFGDSRGRIFERPEVAAMIGKRSCCDCGASGIVAWDEDGRSLVVSQVAPDEAAVEATI